MRQLSFIQYRRFYNTHHADIYIYTHMYTVAEMMKFVCVCFVCPFKNLFSIHKSLLFDQLLQFYLST